MTLNQVLDKTASIKKTNRERKQDIEDEDIKNKMTAYAERTKQLDAILSELTKGYCASKCKYTPIGCCNGQYYRDDNLPKEILKLQKQEAIENGWKNEKKHDECKYHSPEGCKLKMYKPPRCIRHLCTDLTDYLKTEFSDSEVLRNFVHIMRWDIKPGFYSYGYSYDERIDSTEGLFSAMDKAIAAGRELVEIKKAKTKR